MRAGMTNLVGRLRRMVNDAGTAVWTNDLLQDALDARSRMLWERPLTIVSQYVAGTATYKRYLVGVGDLEELDPESDARWRVYDSAGAAIGTGDYTVNYLAGEIMFGADQRGSARYLDAFYYDLNGAAGELWRERAGLTSDKYGFSADGGSYQRQQWFEHCERMAERYELKAWPIEVNWERRDGNLE